MIKTTLFKNSWLKIALVLIGSCLATFPLIAQETGQLEELLEQAKEAQADQDYSKALKLYLEGEMLAKENNNYQKLWYIKNNEGNIYMSLSSYGEALGNFNDALTIIGNHPKLASQKVVVLTNIGLLYSENEEREKALTVYKKAYALIDENSPPYNKFVKIVLAVNMADIYNKANQPEKARAILMEVKEEKNKDYASEEIRQGWQINYAETLFLLGETARAEAMMEGLLPETSVQKETTCYLCVLELLSRIYEAQGKLELAIYHTEKGLETQQSLTDKVELYNQLSHLYEQQGKRRLALVYKDSVVLTKDSLAKKINRQLLAANKVKFDIQKYQNELIINEEKRKRDLIIFIIVCVLALVTFFSIYKGLRNRIIKQRQENEIAANKQKIVKLELKELKSDIAEKNRKLSAKALYLSDRNEIIEEVIDSLAGIPEVSNNRKVVDQMRVLKQRLRLDAEWDKFIVHFEEVNPRFFHSLKTGYPKLNMHDIRFLCYMYMNLDLNEISTILGITLDACKKRKQRIAKKMKVPTEKLRDHIAKI